VVATSGEEALVHLGVVRPAELRDADGEPVQVQQEPFAFVHCNHAVSGGY